MSKSEIAPQFAEFAYSLIDKFSDDFETVINVNEKDMICVVKTMITLNQTTDADFTNESEIIYLVQMTEELYSILFDLPKKDRDNLLDKTKPILTNVLDRLKISDTDKYRIIKLSPLIKHFLNILLKNSMRQKSHKKIFPENSYPVMDKNIQHGGHLYNNKLNVIYLTKQSGGDPEFYKRNYGVNYATTGGDPEFYKHNYGVNYSATGGAAGIYSSNNEFNVNVPTDYYATTPPGGSYSTQSLGTMMDRVPTYYKPEM